MGTAGTGAPAGSMVIQLPIRLPLKCLLGAFSQPQRACLRQVKSVPWQSSASAWHVHRRLYGDACVTHDSKGWLRRCAFSHSGARSLEHRLAHMAHEALSVLTTRFSLTSGSHIMGDGCHALIKYSILWHIVIANLLVAELDSSGSVLSVLSEGRHALVGSAVAEARRLITQHGGPFAYRDGVVASRVTDLFEHEAKALAAQLADLYFGTPNASSCHGSRL